jgi:CRP/FNR family transcriptional regulator
MCAFARPEEVNSEQRRLEILTEPFRKKFENKVGTMLKERIADGPVEVRGKICANFPAEGFPNLQGLIKSQGIVTRLRRGEQLAELGHPTRRIYFIESGVVAYTRSSQGGRRQVMEFEMAGSCVLPLDDQYDESPCSTEVLSDTEVYMMSVNSFRRLLLTMPAAREAVALHKAQLLGRVFRSFTNSGCRQGPQKIAWLLAYLSARLAPVGTTFSNPIPIRQIDLADAVGVTSVYVNQILRKLEKQQLILLQKGAAQVIDLAGLKAFARSVDRV